MRRTRQWACALLLLVVGLIDVTPVAAANPSSGGEWVWPATGRISQRYGCTGAWTNGRSGRCRHFHNGVDVANRAGTPIRAAHAGTISYVGYNPWERGRDRAWIVLIKHGNGLTGWYAHLQPRRVAGAQKGDRVRAGDLIGYMGQTGRATGVHLHFALERGGRFINPSRYLPGGKPRRAQGAGAAVESHAGRSAITAEPPAPDQLPTLADAPAIDDLVLVEEVQLPLAAPNQAVWMC